MRTIYLQTQGCTNTLNTNNSINSKLGFHIAVRQLPENRYIVDLAKEERRINIDGKFNSLQSVFRRIEKEVKKAFGESITISDTIERYCHDFYNPKYNTYLACCYYERASETIRLYPQNYCLVAFGYKGTKEYLQMDSATAQYLPILQTQAEQHEKERGWTCHNNKSEDFLRERFAWLIGESIKEQNNDIPFYLTDTLIK